EVVNQPGAVGGECRDVPAAHQVHEHGRKTCLDDVRADAPDDAAVLAPGALDARDHGLEIRAREDVRQAIDPGSDAAPLRVRPREVLDARLALARRQWIRVDSRDVEFLVGERHGAHLNPQSPTPNSQAPREFAIVSAYRTSIASP